MHDLMRRSPEYFFSIVKYLVLYFFNNQYLQSTPICTDSFGKQHFSSKNSNNKLSIIVTQNHKITKSSLNGYRFNFLLESKEDWGHQTSRRQVFHRMKNPIKKAHYLLQTPYMGRPLADFLQLSILDSRVLLFVCFKILINLSIPKDPEDCATSKKNLINN